MSKNTNRGFKIKIIKDLRHGRNARGKTGYYRNETAYDENGAQILKFILSDGNIIWSNECIWESIVSLPGPKKPTDNKPSRRKRAKHRKKYSFRSDHGN